MVVRFPGTSAAAIEHIIRADVHHLDVQRLTYLGDIACPFRIDLTAQLQVIFSSIYCSICCAVDNCVRFCTGNYTFAGFLVSDIHLFHVHAKSFYAAAGKFIHHIMAQLAFNTCYKNLHNYIPSILNNGRQGT